MINEGGIKVNIYIVYEINIYKISSYLTLENGLFVQLHQLKMLILIDRYIVDMELDLINTYLFQ